MRSGALLAAAAVAGEVADGVRGDAAAVAGLVSGAVGRTGWGVEGSALLGDGGAWVAWARLEARVLGLAGPWGLWGEALALDVVATDLRMAARAYEEVERAVAAVVAGVARGADAAGRVGWFDDGSLPPTVRAADVGERSPVPGDVVGLAGLVAAGEGLGGGRVRVLEARAPDGGSAWVVVVPGTQEWSPRSGPNPFDVTSDLRAVTGDATAAAAGVAAALELARSSSAGSRPDDPVLLVGHSQGGILAAALASDPGFTGRHRVTHLVTSGSPVALFPVPEAVRVLSVEHLDDPVPRLDLSPVPQHASWVSVRVPALGLPLDARRHALDAYVRTVRAAEEAPRGTVAGLDGWRASAGDFLGTRVLSATEVVVERSRESARGG